MNARNRPAWRLRLTGAAGLAALLAFLLSTPAGVSLAGSGAPTPQPAPYFSPEQGGEGSNADRLAIPVLPDHPTQVEQGQVVYYYNCMPCHGDRGQGLTDEFRQVWVEDHRNCWAFGCHSGRPGEEGFPLPRDIPAVSGPGMLAQYAAPEDIYAFLSSQHPPQRPGALQSEEYWQVTAYLLELNGRLQAQGHVGPGGRIDTGRGLAVLGGLLALSGLVSAALIAQTRHAGLSELLSHHAHAPEPPHDDVQ